MKAPKKIALDHSTAVYTIEDLPDEIIEFILSFISPYKDLHDCMRVNKRWRKRVLNVVRTKRRQLCKAICEFDVRWNTHDLKETGPMISKRYSHSAVVHDDSMYIFGGCTNLMTTFNDLWQLNLSTRKWVRPVSTGIYPTPKACSTLVTYKDHLILFGGWAYPCSYPFHQSYQLFNELHSFNINEGKWNFINLIGVDIPLPMAGHSVSVHKNNMVVFGGMQCPEPTGALTKTNEIWCLNLDDWNWESKKVIGDKPKERYGHTQTGVDDDHALIMGGCGGPNELLQDVWLLVMKEKNWKWKKVKVNNVQWAPPDAWCHPTCRVGNHIVILNRLRSNQFWRPTNIVSPSNLPRVSLQIRPSQQDRDENVNGRRGTLRPQIPINNPPREPQIIPVPIIPSTSNFNNSSEYPIRLAAFEVPEIQLPYQPIRQIERLEALRKMEYLLQLKQEKINAQKSNKPKKNPLGMYLLDISNVTNEEPEVTWVKPRVGIQANGPEETLLYTLIQGRGELIMFGGIQKGDQNFDNMMYNLNPSLGTTKVSNNLHFISPPKDIV